MKFNALPPLKVLLLCIVIIIFQFSCTKDSDLLIEYVLADSIIPTEDSESNSESQEVTETTIDLENAVISTNEDVAVLFNMLNNTQAKVKEISKVLNNLRMAPCLYKKTV